jgi:hypothetical protein
MVVLGFTHFAVGYFFMIYGASRFRLRIPDATWIVTSIALGLPYYFTPATAYASVLALLYTTVFCHFAENAVYQVYRRPGSARPLAREAIFPFVAGLVALRGIAVWRGGYDPWMNGAAIVVFLAMVRWRLPASDWKAGTGALTENLPLVGLFGGVAVFLHDAMWAWDLFIIWHYVTWILYQWSGAPALRPRLVWSHAVFGAIYVVLAGGVLWNVLALPADVRVTFVMLAGPLAFYAQTMTHNLITLGFRRYAAPS